MTTQLLLVTAETTSAHQGQAHHDLAATATGEIADPVLREVALARARYQRHCSRDPTHECTAEHRRVALAHSHMLHAEIPVQHPQARAVVVCENGAVETVWRAPPVPPEQCLGHVFLSAGVSYFGLLTLMAIGLVPRTLFSLAITAVLAVAVTSCAYRIGTREERHVRHQQQRKRG